MDENARKFDHRIKNPDPQIVATLAAVDEIRGVFRVGLRMTPQAITRLRKSVLVTSAGASTRIEGSKLSNEEVRKIMFETTPAYLTPKEMTELVDWTRETLEKERFHPLLIIANFIIEFLKIHPFEDGNGRLSRILTNLLLLRSGYPFVECISHERIIEQRKDQYYLALRSSQATFKTEHETIAPWLNFFLSIVKKQAAKALALVEEKNHEDTMSPKQNKVLEYLLKVNEAAPGEIAIATGILLPTVRKALLRLVELRKLKPIGRGRATRYVKI